MRYTRHNLKRSPKGNKIMNDAIIVKRKCTKWLDRLETSVVISGIVFTLVFVGEVIVTSGVLSV